MSPRVLVVDDDAAVRRTLVNTMTRCGYDAVSASDVTGALVLVGSEELDAVLCDFHIGLESGLDVVRACRARHGQNLFIAMLTGEDDDETRTLAAGAGADLVLAKPVSPAELRTHVGEALAHRRAA
jgi:DNA-binding response OmpR family regulator